MRVMGLKKYSPESKDFAGNGRLAALRSDE